jgi:L-fucose isomerase-like protein
MVSFNLVSIFFFDTNSSYKEIEKDDLIKNVLEEFDLEDNELNYVVVNNNDRLKINFENFDCVVLFPFSTTRYSSLINLAETKVPIIIGSREDSFDGALEIYEYLADYPNVEISFEPEEFKEKLRILKAVKWIEKVKVCLFNSEEQDMDNIAWYKNPIMLGRLNIHNINPEYFFNVYNGIESEALEKIAGQWKNDYKVIEPSFEDLMKSVRVYVAMKETMKSMEAEVAYVLWCGQFTEKLGTKMCFALAKLADDGIPVGCWRGENLLPLLILYSITNKPIFVCEVFTRNNNVVTFRHCFAPSSYSTSKIVLRKWRNMEGTVTGYCQLPKGDVTLVNCGIGDKIVIVKGKLVDCKDLGGENCRMTVWVEIENETVINQFVGREFAMVYGDYRHEVKELTKRLNLEVIL